MSRLGYLARNPKRTTGALATMLVAAGLTVGSGAVLTDNEATDGNSITAGTADISVFGSASPVIDGNTCRDATDAFVDVGNVTAACREAETATGSAGRRAATFTVTNLSPGQPALTRCFRVRNRSDVPVALQLDVERTDGVASADDLAGALDVRVARQSTPALDNVVVAATRTLAEQDAQGMEPADLIPGATGGVTRRALEPGGDEYTYCVRVALQNPNADQSSIEGDTVRFEVRALAQSIYGQTLPQSAYPTRR